MHQNLHIVNKQLVGFWGATYRSGPYTTILKLLKGGSRGLGCLNELKVGLAARYAVGFRHDERLEQLS